MPYYVLAFCDPKAGEPPVATVHGFVRRSQAEHFAIEVFAESSSVKMLEVTAEWFVKKQTVLTPEVYPAAWAAEVDYSADDIYAGDTDELL